VIPINPTYTVSYQLAAIDSLPGEEGIVDFCADVEFKQLVSGSRNGATGGFSSTGGIQFNSFPGRVEHVATRLLGNGDDLPDPDIVSLYANVELARQGSEAIQSFVDVEFEVGERRYRTIISRRGREEINHYDRSAVQQIDYSYERGGSCRRGDALLIRTDLVYDGYAYNFYDLTDSVRLVNLEATLYNYSF
jgi:hypothetical protein